MQLLVRHSRGVTATSAGEILYKRARAILASVEETRTELLNLKDTHRETINLGLSPGLMSLLGGAILEAAPCELPSVQLNLIEQMSTILVEAVENDEIEVAIVSDAPPRDGLARLPLINEELLLVTAVAERPPRETLTFAEALAYPLVIGGPRATVRRTVEAEARRRGLELKIANEVSSVTIMKRMVARGGVSTIMPVSTVLLELRAGELSVTPIVEPVFNRTTCIVHSDRRALTDGEDALVRFVHKLAPAVVRDFGSLAVGVTEALADTA
jgi:LysR family nitrogen assimilation transcriptional regulator